MIMRCKFWKLEVLQVSYNWLSFLSSVYIGFWKIVNYVVGVFD